MHGLFLMGLASVVWLVYGYSLSFGSDIRGFVGGMDHFFEAGVGSEIKQGLTIPKSFS